MTLSFEGWIKQNIFEAIGITQTENKTGESKWPIEISMI